MPSFDISSELDWQEMDNAITQALREVSTRFDFKGLESKIEMDKKAGTVTITCSQAEKLSSVRDVFYNKVIKRGISLLSLDEQKEEPASGTAARQLIRIQNGISKEKAKEIIKKIKDERIKVQAQIQDEQVRVTGKSRDLLQEVIQMLKSEQDNLKVPMEFGNFRS